MPIFFRLICNIVCHRNSFLCNNISSVSSFSFNSMAVSSTKTFHKQLSGNAVFRSHIGDIIHIHPCVCLLWKHRLMRIFILTTNSSKNVVWLAVQTWTKNEKKTVFQNLLNPFLQNLVSLHGYTRVYITVVQNSLKTYRLWLSCRSIMELLMDSNYIQ